MHGGKYKFGWNLKTDDLTLEYSYRALKVMMLQHISTSWLGEGLHSDDMQATLAACCAGDMPELDVGVHSKNSGIGSGMYAAELQGSANQQLLHQCIKPCCRCRTVLLSCMQDSTCDCVCCSAFAMCSLLLSSPPRMQCHV